MKPEPPLSVPFIQAAALAAALAVAAIAACGVAAAEPPPSSAPPDGAAPKPSVLKGPPTRVSGVTVTASIVTPHVLSTFPAQDAKVAPGLMVLRVTYDTHMRPGGWSYAPEGKTAYPDCARSPRLLEDKASFVVICRTLPGRAYAVWFNRPPLVDFASLARRPADAYELRFVTTNDDPVRTLAEAMKADPAVVHDNPVEPPGLPHLGQDVDAPGG